jgi:Ras GTPase-activating-like protein IQGAP2/3
MYIDKFIQLIRNNPSVFRLLVESSNHSLPHLDLLVETFAFSFFEDLMNPHNSEAELLKVMELLIELDLKRGQHITDIYNEGASSVLSKMLTNYTKRRSQRKYLKLLFKKPLLQLVHDAEKDLTIRPKDIYVEVMRNREKFAQVAEDPAPKKSSFFGVFKSQKKEKPKKSATEESPDLGIDFYMEDSEVRFRIEHKSNKIIEFAHILLQSIYENVSKMPYGLRWVCRTLSDLIRKREPESTELDRNIMLGTLLYTKWWLPSIFSADENGLLQDTNITDTTRANLMIIGNVGSM